MAPEHLGAALVPRQHPRQHEQQVGQPVEINHHLRIHALDLGQSEHFDFRAATHGASVVEVGRGQLAAGDHKALEGLQHRRGFVDPSLKRRHLRCGNPQGLRALLDARSEAQAAHGLEMRTELRFGESAAELSARLAEAPAQMLIIGVAELRHFGERFPALLDGARWPVLIVQRGPP